MVLPKSLLKALVIMTLSLFLLSACADTETTRPTILDGMNKEQVLNQSVNRSMDATSLEENEEVEFSVIYVGNLDEILFNSSSHLRALIETYDLQISQPFEVDETMKGIVLHTYEQLADPLQIAKEISQCEEVMMVEAKNLPKIDAAL